MGQGFVIRINNGTLRTLFIEGTSHTGVVATPFQATVPPATTWTAQEPYYEVTSNPGTIWFNFQVADDSKAPGNVEIRLDSDSTSEFEGSLYIASYNGGKITFTPANLLVPQLLVSQTVGTPHAWPLGVLTIVEAVNPNPT